MKMSKLFESNISSKKALLSLVVPVFNECEAIPFFLERINVLARDQLQNVSLELVFVNDGSKDETLNVLLAWQQKNPIIKIIDLSRNFGKEAALTAGLDHACGDAIIPMDVDLQDPPELIPKMLQKWQQGYEMVMARRVDRQADSWSKRTTANWFYRLHNRISKPELPENVGDFRLMDRCVIEALKTLPESQRFMKGLFAWAGFRSTFVDYARPERVAGVTKFNFWKLWNFALEGITSFSSLPLRIWTYIGSFVSLSSFVYALITTLKVIVHGVDVPGYASLMVSITFLGGLQLIGIGVLGEYLGRTYMESKRRPVFLVRKIYSQDIDQ